MVLMALLLGLTLIVVPLLVIASLRRWGLEEADTDTRLHSPQTHTASYVVPPGQDPAVVRAALKHAGFVTVMEHGGDHLLVECEVGQRNRAREVIEHAGGPEQPVSHAHFEDDPT
jgi:hypothetical protein